MPVCGRGENGYETIISRPKPFYNNKLKKVKKGAGKLRDREMETARPRETEEGGTAFPRDPGPRARGEGEGGRPGGHSFRIVSI